MIRLLKLWYWKWVVSCLQDDMEDVRFWLPKVNKRERRLVMKEKVAIIRELIKAQRRVMELSK